MGPSPRNFFWFVMLGLDPSISNVANDIDPLARPEDDNQI